MAPSSALDWSEPCQYWRYAKCCPGGQQTDKCAAEETKSKSAIDVSADEENVSTYKKICKFLRRFGSKKREYANYQTNVRAYRSTSGLSKLCDVLTNYDRIKKYLFAVLILEGLAKFTAPYLLRSARGTGNRNSAIRNSIWSSQTILPATHKSHKLFFIDLYFHQLSIRLILDDSHKSISGLQLDACVIITFEIRTFLGALIPINISLMTIFTSTYNVRLPY